MQWIMNITIIALPIKSHNMKNISLLNTVELKHIIHFLTCVI